MTVINHTFLITFIFHLSDYPVFILPSYLIYLNIYVVLGLKGFMFLLSKRGICLFLCLAKPYTATKGKLVTAVCGSNTEHSILDNGVGFQRGSVLKIVGPSDRDSTDPLHRLNGAPKRGSITCHINIFIEFNILNGQLFFYG